MNLTDAAPNPAQQPDLPNALYRFRSAAALLGEFQELERQTIYFASAEELNDPMEGYQDIYWRGDAIVWRNLFKHFILVTLMLAYEHLNKRVVDLARLRDLILCTPEDLPSQQARLNYEKLCDRFFSIPGVCAVVEKLALCRQPLRREPLTHILRGLNPLVLHLILNQAAFIQEPGEGSIDHQLTEMLVRLQRTLDGLDALLEDQQTSAANFLADMEAIADQYHIRTENARTASNPRPPLFLLPTFATHYVQSLGELTYFPNYVACFTSNPTNASMWGMYGNEHRGVCLKFRPSPDSLGRPSLELNGIRGWSGSSKHAGLDPHFSWAPHSFRKMTYDDAFPEIDFSRAIGRIPTFAINRFWFRGEGGQASPIRDEIAKDEQTWRDQYWANFEAAGSCKTADWAHECEYRLGLHSSLGGLEDKPSRVLKYRFSSLAGIIFGASTSEDDKVEVIRLIAEKCRAESRRDFEVYQSRYSRGERGFRLVRLAELP